MAALIWKTPQGRSVWRIHEVTDGFHPMQFLRRNIVSISFKYLDEILEWDIQRILYMILCISDWVIEPSSWLSWLVGWLRVTKPFCLRQRQKKTERTKNLSYYSLNDVFHLLYTYLHLILYTIYWECIWIHIGVGFELFPSKNGFRIDRYVNRTVFFQISGILHPNTFRNIHLYVVQVEFVIV